MPRFLLYSCFILLVIFSLALFFRYDRVNEQSNSTMDLTSDAFDQNDTMPKQYTCDGDNVNPPLSMQVAALLLTGAIASLVASTGWFTSPFVFVLYFNIVVLTVFFPVYVSVSFVVTLLGVVVLTIGEGDWNIKFLTILSLLAVIPVSLYLRDIFLSLKEAEKIILILKRSHKRYRNNVEKVLDNAVHRFATDIRTEMSILRQLAAKTQKIKSTEKRHDEYIKLNDSIDRALTILSTFETDSTGSKLVTKPHTLESDEQIRQLIRDSL